MTVLINKRQETFAQLVSQGVPDGEAALRAGYSKSTARVPKIIKDTPAVSERIVELRRGTLLRSERTSSERLAMLDRIADEAAEANDRGNAIRAIAEANKMVEGALVATRTVNENTNVNVDMSEEEAGKMLDVIFGN